MDHSLQSVNLDRLIKGVLFCNILHNPEIKLRCWDIGMCFSDLLGLLLRSNGCDDGVTPLEEDIENMRCNEATTACAVIRFSCCVG
jgi:hypothetical protein